MSVSLLLIDPQNDFCSPDGTLYVPGAEFDCKRIASFIDANSDAIDSIHISLDTHPFYHIAHPVFWKDKNGNQPAPYTMISHTNFAAGEYRPMDESLEKRAEEYLLNLESRGRYTLTVWPPHCLIATPGACVNKDLWNAAHRWELAHPGKSIDYVQKAVNPLTEHYSIVQAEVPDPEDESTRTNFALIDKIKNTRIIVAGEALSHCVSNTIRDLCVYLPAAQITLLSDCVSNVTGFEYISQEFLEEYGAKGMQTAQSVQLAL
ncbi:hypothetical protein [Treponema brennaborense]|uniref:Isochorismatase hydrolase n=1 Tax=Treponema brennaborense (strain DSM 12168 / CIP 105900 / DD5/3) TaxID=906968 RepID=F4LNU1_TREBD|nr:hypothetical protein [Treponema brennaborense]AEE16926.1 hypothetical protein Trebr_1503 [Treponema brennaborense DSM 12168]